MNTPMLNAARRFFEERCKEHQNDQMQITFEDFTMLKQAYEDAIANKGNTSTIIAKQCPKCLLFYVGKECQACESNDR